MTTTKTVLGADDVGAVVVDCGSWVIRVGSAGDDSPRAVVPAAAGLKPDLPPSSPKNGASVGSRRFVAGDQMILSPLSFSEVSPIHLFDEETGTAAIRDWDAMQAAWSAAFEALRLPLSESL